MRVFVELWSFSTSHLLNSGTKDIQWMSCTSDERLLSQAGLPGNIKIQKHVFYCINTCFLFGIFFED